MRYRAVEQEETEHNLRQHHLDVVILAPNVNKRVEICIFQQVSLARHRHRWNCTIFHDVLRSLSHVHYLQNIFCAIDEKPAIDDILIDEPSRCIIALWRCMDNRKNLTASACELWCWMSSFASSLLWCSFHEMFFLIAQLQLMRLLNKSRDPGEGWRAELTLFRHFQSFSFNPFRESLLSTFIINVLYCNCLSF